MFLKKSLLTRRACVPAIGALLLLSACDGVQQGELSQFSSSPVLSENVASSTTQSVNNMADLRVLPLPSGCTSATATAECCVLVHGYHARGDGGGGTFCYNSAATAASTGLNYLVGDEPNAPLGYNNHTDRENDEDGGTVITPAENLAAYPPTAGRWVRHLSEGTLNVRWFGATGHAASALIGFSGPTYLATDAAWNTLGIKRAIKSALNGNITTGITHGATVLLPPGQWVVNETIEIPGDVLVDLAQPTGATLPVNIILTGAGRDSSVLLPAAGKVAGLPLLRVIGTRSSIDRKLTIENLRLEGNDVNSSVVDFVNGLNGGNGSVTLRNISVFNSHGDGIRIASSMAAASIRDINFRSIVGSALHVDGPSGGLLYQSSISNIYATIIGQHVLYFNERGQNLVIAGVTAENFGGFGLYMKGTAVGGMDISMVYLEQGPGYQGRGGVEIDGGSEFELTSFRIKGGGSSPAGVLGGPPFHLVNAFAVSIHGGEISGFVPTDGSSPYTVPGSLACSNYGVRFDGTFDAKFKANVVDGLIVVNPIERRCSINRDYREYYVPSGLPRVYVELVDYPDPWAEGRALPLQNPSDPGAWVPQARRAIPGNIGSGPLSIGSRVGLNWRNPRGLLHVNRDDYLGTVLGTNPAVWVSGAPAASTHVGIGFGYAGADSEDTGIGQKPPGFVGFVATSSSGNTKGALVFATRDSTVGTDPPTERLRINSDGRISANDNTVDVISADGELVGVFPVYVTSQLPAAGNLQSGQIVVEDAGTTKNLIIYVGAQRVRISGVPF